MTTSATSTGTLVYDAPGGSRARIVTGQDIQFTESSVGIFPVPAGTDPFSGWQISQDQIGVITSLRIVNKTGREIAVALNDGDQISLSDLGEWEYRCAGAADTCCPVTYVYVYLAWQEQVDDGSIEFAFFGDA